VSRPQAQPEGTLTVGVSLDGQCNQAWSPARLCRKLEHSRLQVVVYRRGVDYDRALTASRSGVVSAALLSGRFVIAFTWAGSGILSTRGWRPFDKYALSVRPAA